MLDLINEPTLQLMFQRYSRSSGLGGIETKHTLDHERDLCSAVYLDFSETYLYVAEWDFRSAVCLDLSEMYSNVSERSACAQVCATVAATGVRCCELANSLVLDLRSPS